MGIHSHGVGYSDAPVDSDIDAALAKFAIESHVALTDLDREIQESFTPSPDDSGDTVEENLLFNVYVYRPENCRGYAQKLLVGITLLALKLHWEAPSPEAAKLITRFHVKVQGNPGTGKTFVIKTSLNCIRRVTGKSSNARLIAPSSCAARLSDGETSQC